MKLFADLRAQVGRMTEAEGNEVRTSNPNESAVEHALLVLKVAERVGLQPSGVAASHAGSIVIHFENGRVYTDVESGSEGDIQAVITVKKTGKVSPDVWQVEPNEKGVSAALQRIKTALDEE